MEGVALTVGLGAAVLLAGLWFFMRLMGRPMGPSARRLAPGQFVTLSDGMVHYRWHGPVTGEVLVLVHGLTTPSFVWRDMLPGLTEAGFRVLTFDHFGRGFSDRPWARHTFDFYTREIDELLAALGVDGPVHMLGYSMGGGIVAHYAAHRPERVAAAVLLAPVGFVQSEPGFVARWPVIGDVLMFLLGGWRIRRDARLAARAEGTDSQMLRWQIRETRFAGYTGAVLSSLRHVIYVDLTSAHAAMRDHGLPLLAIFAENDGLIPTSSAIRMSEVNPAAQTVEIKGSGHGLAITHADQVNAAVIPFLKAAPARPR